MQNLEELTDQLDAELEALDEDINVPEQLGWTFEGIRVQAVRISPSAPGKFPCVINGEPIELHPGDIIAYQVEAQVEEIGFATKFKGGVAVKPLTRTHKLTTVPGSQEIVGITRAKITPGA